jgi:deoxyribodipyrimidine photolyase-related protein
MKTVTLIFPHQLFKTHPAVERNVEIILIEEFLFFKQYKFHKQKLALHRASMKCYEAFLIEKGFTIKYIEAKDILSDIRLLIDNIGQNKIKKIKIAEEEDYLLNRRLNRHSIKNGIIVERYESPMFLNSKEEVVDYFSKKNKFFQTDFYISQRKKRNILVDDFKNPIGGKWSFDDENRLKYPKNKITPTLDYKSENEFAQEAIGYVSKNFPENYGSLTEILFPTNFNDSEEWLHKFFDERFSEFGVYEDAILKNEHYINHSVLTPMLNIGLLTPDQIIQQSLSYAEQNKIPLNSVEGFIRQIIGWREFMRGVYNTAGTKQRTKNFWGFSRRMPESFWSGTTGILPIDITIKKILETGYAHHIERLMVLGNFMVLCEFDPDDVYLWFMEMFADAYDWVMVPNVYGMSQFADGGLLSTKPYISGSNYLFKMSNYPKSKKKSENTSWEEIWDGLFWRFMHVNRNFFTKNPRLSMLINLFDKMPQAKKEIHLKNAEKYLSTL